MLRSAPAPGCQCPQHPTRFTWSPGRASCARCSSAAGMAARVSDPAPSTPSASHHRRRQKSTLCQQGLHAGPCRLRGPLGWKLAPGQWGTRTRLPGGSARPGVLGARPQRQQRGQQGSGSAGTPDVLLGMCANRAKKRSALALHDRDAAKPRVSWSRCGTGWPRRFLITMRNSPVQRGPPGTDHVVQCCRRRPQIVAILVVNAQVQVRSPSPLTKDPRRLAALETQGCWTSRLAR